MNTKNNLKAVGMTALAMILIAMFTLALVGCSPQKQRSPENDFSTELIDSEHVTLIVSAPRKWDNMGYISKTITATVLPATATNKAVDWSVEWGDGESSGTVTDYITVTPESDGSNTATVLCKQAFTGNIVITVTTRESGYTASCVVTFVGIPTDIALSGSVSPSGDTITLGIGKAYEFAVNLSNPFNSVGGQFSEVSYSLIGVGSMVLGHYEKYNSGGSNWFGEETVTLDSMKDEFMVANFVDGKIVLTTKRSIESYYSKSGRMDGGRTAYWDDKFKSFVDDCYFRLVVRENVSKLSKEYQIRFDDTIVTGVNISSGEMQF